MRITSGEQLLQQLNQGGIHSIKFEDGHLRTRNLVSRLLRKIGDAFLSLTAGGRTILRERNERLHEAMAERLRHTDIDGNHPPATQAVLERIREILGRRNAQAGPVQNVQVGGGHPQAVGGNPQAVGGNQQDAPVRNAEPGPQDNIGNGEPVNQQNPAKADESLIRKDVQQDIQQDIRKDGASSSASVDVQGRKNEETRLSYLDSRLGNLSKDLKMSLPGDVGGNIRELLGDRIRKGADLEFMNAVNGLMDIVRQAHARLGDLRSISADARMKMAFDALFAALKPGDVGRMTDAFGIGTKTWTDFSDKMARTGVDVVKSRRKMEERLPLLDAELGKLSKELKAPLPEDADRNIRMLLDDIVRHDSDLDFLQAVALLKDIVLKAHERLGGMQDLPAGARVKMACDALFEALTPGALRSMAQRRDPVAETWTKQLGLLVDAAVENVMKERIPEQRLAHAESEFTKLWETMSMSDKPMPQDIHDGLQRLVFFAARGSDHEFLRVVASLKDIAGRVHARLDSMAAGGPRTEQAFRNMLETLNPALVERVEQDYGMAAWPATADRIAEGIIAGYIPPDGNP